MNWQRFRDLLIQPTGHDAPDKPCPEIIDRILRAAEATTTISEVEGDSPAPDRHLVYLWKHSDELEKTYIAGGRTYHNLVKIREQTAKIHRHAKLLAGQRWEEYFQTFFTTYRSRKALVNVTVFFWTQ
ncbi:hypothetical protein HPB48_022542 [Haemaphysalis longicornis]|uniref:Uncharacterized protein n=1 Tax=Haemaphysalis longicornis TaxID=44386 RepID=A0A9J6FGF5_HAELO|nr:hypothetical protein HPB48_022542 [Haemaphysalis longicornis]